MKCLMICRSWMWKNDIVFVYDFLKYTLIPDWNLIRDVRNWSREGWTTSYKTFALIHMCWRNPTTFKYNFLQSSLFKIPPRVLKTLIISWELRLPSYKVFAPNLLTPLIFKLTFLNHVELKHQLEFVVIKL